MSYSELSYLSLQPVAHLAAREEADRLARIRNAGRMAVKAALSRR